MGVEVGRHGAEAPPTPLESLPTHFPFSGEGWKPVSHRQSKEPSVLTQFPPKHWSLAAHSSTSRKQTPVIRPSQWSLPCYHLFSFLWALSSP